MEKINTLRSKPLQALAKHLMEQHIPISYFGRAWSGQAGNWVYFDTILDLAALRTAFQLDSQIEVHQNLDPRSGTESGFVDTRTGEGLMGKLGELIME